MIQDCLGLAPASGPPRLTLALVTETFPPEINGVAMTLGHFVDGLRQRGHRLQLVRPRRCRADTPARQADFEEILAPGIPIPGYRGLRFGLPMPYRLRRLWTRQRPDLVHVATEGPLGWSALAAASQLGLPLTTSFHTRFDHYSAHYGCAWLQQPVAAYLRQFHARAAATFVPTAEMARTLQAQGYARVQVLARGVDQRLFDPARRSPALRATWGVGEHGLAVLVVSRLAPEKNLPLAFAAFEAIQSVRPDARLILVGDGPARKQLAKTWPMAHFAGMRTGADLAAHYASSDLFLFPSLTETFGNVTLEAMASGLPVVAYHAAAAGELIEDGRSGRLAAPGDAAGFIAAARDLAAAPDVRQRLGRAARQRVASMSWEAIQARLESTLLQIAQRHTPLAMPADPFLRIMED